MNACSVTYLRPNKLELAKEIQLCQGMETVAADLQTWGETKNSSPEVNAQSRESLEMKTMRVWL